MIYTPFRLMNLGLQSAYLTMEAQTVMTYRLWGMAGLWPTRPTEQARMVAEKVSAFAGSACAAGHATMTGQLPDQIAAAALKPIRKTTRANSRRLTRQGTRRPKRRT